MSSQSAARIAWPLSALTVSLVACGLALAVLNRADLRGLVYLTAMISSALVGGLVATRRPANPIGWLFVASAACFALAFTTAQYATYGLITRPGSLPGARAMAWPHTFLIVPAIASVLAFLPLLFPDGHLISPRWRPAVWVAGFFCISASVSSAFRPGEVQEIPGIANPMGIEVLRPVVELMDAVLFPLWPAVIVVSAASLVVRFRRSRGAERQQMKWLTYAIFAWAFLLLLTFPAEAVDRRLFLAIDSCLALAFAGIPVAVGIAILHDDLYDIDLVINRTLVYGSLTAIVAGIYVIVVGGLGVLLEIEGNVLLSLLASGLIAVVFAPLRDRLQRGVNRLMYGERDDPYKVLSRLGQRLEATLEPQAVLPTLVRTVREALRLPYAAIELGRDACGVAAATDGVPACNPLAIPLTYQGETVGRLLLSPRSGTDTFSPADLHLLDDLARQAGAAAHAVGLHDRTVRLHAEALELAQDLQRSREDLVSAREEERRRLRRDLHDGLGPALGGLILKLDIARDLIGRDPGAAEALLLDLKAQTQAAVEDIRRLVHALRPPALDELGLVGALRQAAASYDHYDGGLRISIESPQDLMPLPAAVEVAAYRIVQEALTNAARHARAGACTVRVTLAEGALCLEIADDGVGLPEGFQAGVGLVSMRERAAELGGAFAVELAPASGTRVLARLPLPKER